MDVELEFWMVYGAGQSAPTHRHPSAEKARDEAHRLAQRSPGIAFYVLHAIERHEREVAPTVGTRLLASRLPDLPEPIEVVTPPDNVPVPDDDLPF